MRSEAVGAARPVERREDVDSGKAQRVGGPVESLDERDATGGSRSEKRAKVLRHDARDVRVDDEDAAGLDAIQTCLDRRSLAAAGIGNGLGAGVDRRGGAFF